MDMVFCGGHRINKTGTLCQMHRDGTGQSAPGPSERGINPGRREGHTWDTSAIQVIDADGAFRMPPLDQNRPTSPLQKPLDTGAMIALRDAKAARQSGQFRHVRCQQVDLWQQPVQ